MFRSTSLVPARLAPAVGSPVVASNLSKGPEAVPAPAPKPAKPEPPKPTVAVVTPPAPKPESSSRGNEAPMSVPSAPTKPPTPEPEKSLLPSAATSPAKPALPAELAALDEQFQKLQGERVTAVFEADVLKLNTGYSGGLEREVAKEKAAGHLEAVLALEAEKKLIADKQPMPSPADEETSNKKTPDALKKLRVIYRDAYTKLETQRGANLALITSPLMVRLGALESDYTKKDRIADAKAVRDYREALGDALKGEVAETGAAQGAVRVTG